MRNFIHYVRFVNWYFHTGAPTKYCPTWYEWNHVHIANR